MDTIRSFPGTSALVLDSPHSGTEYPADFDFSCDAQLLRRAEDTHVEKLYAFAPEIGAAWVEARFPRSYLDVNRGLDEIDPAMFEPPWLKPPSDDPRVRSKLRLGKGLIWRCTDEGMSIYDRRLRIEEGEQRIAACWQPYHAAVAEAIHAAHARHGWSIHLNCHSMPAVAASHATEFPGLAHADFVVGDRDGSTASPQLSAALCEWLRARGYDVAYNHPYKGVELVRRYGDPQRGRHSIQLEINRALYMDEDTLQLNQGFEPLRADLRRMAEWLQQVDPRAP